MVHGESSLGCPRGGKLFSGWPRGDPGSVRFLAGSPPNESRPLLHPEEAQCCPYSRVSEDTHFPSVQIPLAGRTCLSCAEDLERGMSGLGCGVALRNDLRHPQECLIGVPHRPVSFHLPAPPKIVVPADMPSPDMPGTTAFPSARVPEF